MSKARKSPTASVPAATNAAPTAPHVAPTGEPAPAAEVSAKAGSPRPPGGHYHRMELPHRCSFVEDSASTCMWQYRGD